MGKCLIYTDEKGENSIVEDTNDGKRIISVYNPVNLQILTHSIQIIRHFVFSIFIVFAVHLDTVYV